MHELSTTELAAMLTTTDADTRALLWVGPLNDSMRACSINTAVRQSAFLAQILLESSELRQLQESLGYSAQRLRQVWPQRFPSDDIAEQYAHNPQKLANKVYALRMGNGDEASGDGWAYRGRGLIQLTGRDNYAHFSAAMDCDALGHPDLLQQPAGAALSAAWFWRTHGLNELADGTLQADGDQQFSEITRRINGGLNGLPQRHAYWDRIRKILGVATPP
ncbi:MULTISPECIES: glycoside hydrolase family 19 protein [unclassified Janthinobacterium]|uniref:glycoside hydrolase family 19 protein n=1 Tax=unclassified Janthinobacterium TaxID=2610881 RepID=UPI001617F344|nr:MULTISPECIES: glycoside hydrolase family 19 protein [unclassified Janthinobacterium]MBB5369996.1 putative chitinase [Janthinobacterium sp. K2C7]MBB5382802.1 putative chitinase [Janthinobacterium sp. K2Li3]MBB5384787.1 putative chitinase [Janthinobacterium sp. K2E3]